MTPSDKKPEQILCEACKSEHFRLDLLDGILYISCPGCKTEHLSVDLTPSDEPVFQVIMQTSGDPITYFRIYIPKYMVRFLDLPRDKKCWASIIRSPLPGTLPALVISPKPLGDNPVEITLTSQKSAIGFYLPLPLVRELGWKAGVALLHEQNGNIHLLPILD